MSGPPPELASQEPTAGHLTDDAVVRANGDGAPRPGPGAYRDLARFGSATVYEASGRAGLIDVALRQVVPGSRIAGPARTVLCGQGDNLMVHAALAEVKPGDILVLTMPKPEPVALVGELLATQAQVHGVAGMLIDAAVRDVDELAALGLPIWARYVSIRGAGKAEAGVLDGPVSVGSAIVNPGDALVLDADGGAIVARDRVHQVCDASRERTERERIKRAKLQGGALSFDLDGLRDRLEKASG